MSTPEQHAYFCELYEALFKDCKVGNPLATNGEIAKRFNVIIADIQRDAREGMVPVEDVISLVNALHVIAAFSEGLEVTSSFDEPGSANLARIALEPLRAKHPNLFTK